MGRESRLWSGDNDTGRTQAGHGGCRVGAVLVVVGCAADYAPPTARLAAASAACGTAMQLFAGLHTDMKIS